jgi:mono/diheme cytochrome c family protein
VNLFSVARLLVLAFVLLLLCGCDYARMTDDEAINTYGKNMPEQPAHTVPVEGGIETLLVADPQNLVNPLPKDPDTVEQGRLAYGYFCRHCHGPKGDGHGTVGQSFAPLPTDLQSGTVQQLRDGEIFARISLGYKRCPPLASTMAEEDRWAVIRYLRFLAAAGGEQP